MFVDWFLSKEVKRALAAVDQVAACVHGNYNATSGLRDIRRELEETIKYNGEDIAEELHINGMDPYKIALITAESVCHVLLSKMLNQHEDLYIACRRAPLEHLWVFCMERLCDLSVFTEDEMTAAKKELCIDIVRVGCVEKGCCCDRRGADKQPPLGC